MTCQPGYIIGSGIRLHEKNFVTTDIQDMDPEMRWCSKCSNYKPPMAHHCSVCKKCIVRMDHHCPWVNNCIGLYNLKYFVLFNFYTCLTCVMSLAVIITYVVQCSHLERPESIKSSNAKLGRVGQIRKPMQVFELREDSGTCNLNPMQAFCVMMVTIIAMIFGVFTIFILCEQLERAMTGDSVVDQYKRQMSGDARVRNLTDQVTKASRLKRLSNCMGTDTKILWLLPFWTDRARVANDVTERDRLCMSGEYRYLMDGRDRLKASNDDDDENIELSRPVVMKLGIEEAFRGKTAFNQGYYFDKSIRLKRGQQWQETEI